MEPDTSPAGIKSGTPPPSVGVVDVVIPCYNDGGYLLDALESLGEERAQGQGVIIVNDGSTDPATLQVLADLRMSGHRVIDRPNGGLSAARNTGWQAATARYVLFLDADNRVDPRFPAAAVGRLEADADIAAVYADRFEFGMRTGIVRQPEVVVADLLVGNRIDACAVFRRSVVEQLGGYDEAMRDGYEDWEFWLRLLGAGHQLGHIAEPYIHYRVREGSLLGRTALPDVRAEVVRYVASKHRALYQAHAPDVVANLHRIQAGDQGAIWTLSRELDSLRASLAKDQEAIHAQGQELVAMREARELLAAEAHRLVGQVDKAKHTLQVHREHIQALQALIVQYEERIAAFEKSRLWRLRRAYHKMRTLLRSGSIGSRKGLRWLRRITFLVSGKGRAIMRRFLAKIFRALYLWTEVRPVRILIGEEELRAVVPDLADPYTQWTRGHFARPSDLTVYKEDIEQFAYRPLVSVLMPVYDPPVKFLDEAIRSVMEQVYPHLELCIADDKSTNPEVRTCLERWCKKDPRVKVVFREENGHISKASNSALQLVEGEFISFMDHDDVLAPDALYHVMKRLNKDHDLDLIYTDEDKINEEGKHSEPHFKPQWCPDHLLSRNYFGHMVTARASLVRKVGAFRDGFEGSQDYDLLLRMTEHTQRVARVPRVLYHWRIHAGSLALSEDVKPYAYHAAKRALTEAFVRRGDPAEVNFLYGFRGYDIRYTTPVKGKVCVIIPTKDQASVLETCLRSLFELTDHPDYEVLVVSNGSTERALVSLLQRMEKEQAGRFRWFEHNEPFNFSELMNKGMERTKAEHILFLNNDTEIIHADWMRAMHEWSRRSTTGAVGAKLLYHNDIIQHAGVIVGLGGVAGHVFAGLHKDGPGYYNYVNTINNYSAVTGACLMVQRSKLEAIGGWDTIFTVEYNDVDLCLRLREKGWYNVYLPHVMLRHHESLTRGHPHMTRESYERHVREVDLFKKRWKDLIADDPCYNPNLTRGGHEFEVGA